MIIIMGVHSIILKMSALPYDMLRSHYATTIHVYLQ